MADKMDQDKCLDEKKQVTIVVSNIPKGLENTGIRNIFSAYGKIVHMSPKGQSRNYFKIFITYSQWSEAKLAISKLNMAKPLNFNISYHKKFGEEHEEKFPEYLPEDEKVVLNAPPLELEPTKKDQCKPKFKTLTTAVQNSDWKEGAFRYYKSIPERYENMIIKDGCMLPDMERYSGAYDSLSSHYEMTNCDDFDVKDLSGYCQQCSKLTIYKCENCAEFFCSEDCLLKKEMHLQKCGSKS